MHHGHAAQQELTQKQLEGHARPHLLDLGKVWAARGLSGLETC